MLWPGVSAGSRAYLSANPISLRLRAEGQLDWRSGRARGAEDEAPRPHQRVNASRSSSRRPISESSRPVIARAESNGCSSGRTAFEVTMSLGARAAGPADGLRARIIVRNRSPPGHSQPQHPRPGTTMYLQNPAGVFSSTSARRRRPPRSRGQRRPRASGRLHPQADLAATAGRERHRPTATTTPVMICVPAR